MAKADAVNALLFDATPNKSICSFTFFFGYDRTFSIYPFHELFSVFYYRYCNSGTLNVVLFFLASASISDAVIWLNPK